jgi:ParB family chromosome partitioning protein
MARKTLSTYIQDNGNNEELAYIPITAIEIANNSRKYFDPEKLQELADSISQYGILEPLIVAPSGYKYVLVVGERRYRAALLIGLKNIPVVIKKISQDEARIINLIENLQREELNPYEETCAILEILKIQLNLSEQEVIEFLRQIKNKTHKDQENALLVQQIFEKIGTFSPESYLASRIPLLELSDPLKEVLSQGKIPYTKALLINKVEINSQSPLIQEVVEQNISVKVLKLKINNLLAKPQPPSNSIKERVNAIAKSLSSLDEKKRKKVEGLLGKIEQIIRELNIIP